MQISIKGHFELQEKDVSWLLDNLGEHLIKEIKLELDKTISFDDTKKKIIEYIVLDSYTKSRDYVIYLNKKNAEMQIKLAGVYERHQ